MCPSCVWRVAVWQLYWKRKNVCKTIDTFRFRQKMWTIWWHTRKTEEITECLRPESSRDPAYSNRIPWHPSSSDWDISPPLTRTNVAIPCSLPRVQRYLGRNECVYLQRKKAPKIFTVIPIESSSFSVHQRCNPIRGEPVALASLSLPESTISGKILNSATEEPVTSWSHKYYVLCFPHCCLMFHIEVGTVKQTTAHKRMGPLIPRGIILAEGVFSTGPARKSY